MITTLEKKLTWIFACLHSMNDMIANQVDDCDPVNLREFLPKGSGTAPIDALPDSWGGFGKIIGAVAHDSASDPSISSNAIFTRPDATVKTKSEMPIPATLDKVDDILKTLSGADLEVPADAPDNSESIMFGQGVRGIIITNELQLTSWLKKQLNFFRDIYVSRLPH